MEQPLQKKLFFNLKKLKNQIAPQSEGDLKNEDVEKIANKLDVSKDEVVSMNRRLSGKEIFFECTSWKTVMNGKIG